jgi:hypothetical protein
LKIPDNVNYLQDAFASRDKPFAVEDSNKLLKDETEWGELREKMM